MKPETILTIAIILLSVIGFYFSVIHRGPDERVSKYRNITEGAREMRNL
jgi:hypothetical protein